MTTNKEENKLGFLNILILFLSIYVLVALLIDTIFKLPPEISRILSIFDIFICVIFFIDFCIRFYQASDKKKFMYWGWIDLISSIPAVNLLRIGRLFRLIRLIRIIRAFKSSRLLLNYLFQNKAQGAFSSVAILAILLIIFSSIAIIQVENDPNSNIKTAEDALWWSYVTITTVGYGDKFPVTTEGRLIGAVLMTAGVGMFGTFTGFIASLFLDNKNEKPKTS